MPLHLVQWGVITCPLHEGFRRPSHLVEGNLDSYRPRKGEPPFTGITHSHVLPHASFVIFMIVKTLFAYSQLMGPRQYEIYASGCPRNVP